MRIYNIFANLSLIITLFFITAGCGKTDDADKWNNALSFGTGMNGFDLTGESDRLPHSTIYFRLETMDDMAGSPVRIIITNIVTQEQHIYNYDALQSYGHLYLGPVALPETGNFTAEGKLTEKNISIATVQLTLY